MKKIIILALVPVLLLTALSIYSFNRPIPQLSEMSDEEWQRLNTKNQNPRLQTKEAFLAEIDEYAYKISRHLHKEDWLSQYPDRYNKITLKYTGGISHVAGGYSHRDLPIPKVFYSKSFGLDMAPMAHEITHIIAPLYNSLSLREGLACYMQNLYGKNKAIFNFGEPIHPLAKHYITDDYQDVIDYMGVLEMPSQAITTGKRISFYTLSHSFTQYLIDEYGIDKFVELYDSNQLNEAYVKLYNLSLDQIKSNWLEFLSTQEASPETVEELLHKHLKIPKATD